jgi:formylmethanofuran dehydrogenase subunit B
VTAERTVSSVACLGCGCVCDDLVVTTTSDRIVAVERACAMGVAWFGHGGAPTRVSVDGRDATMEAALRSAAAALAAARRPVVFLGLDLSRQAQREAVALADLCRARLDSVTSGTASGTALPAIMAAQESGAATATLGEVRNRADVVVFWDVDGSRHPRFAERYAPDAVGLLVEKGRRGRHVVSIAVAQPAWPGADVAVRVRPDDERAALAALTACVIDADAALGDESHFAGARHLARIVSAGRYVAVVFDAEAPGLTPRALGDRAAGLYRLSHALNHRSRGAVVGLRGGGNRSGADAVTTAATGFPCAVDFARGAPAYRPHERFSDALGAADVVVALGEVQGLARESLAAAGRARVIAIGPLVSDGPFEAAHVAIDTGRAGVHEGGTALRMDDVPVPLTALLGGPPSAAATIAALVSAVQNAVIRVAAAGGAR